MNNEKKNILVVDDEPANRDLLSEALEFHHYNVTEAEDGLIAMKILQDYNVSYDLVLLDRMMPNLDGIATLEQIKQDERLKDIPVIMQSAAGSSENIKEGIASGAYYYLIKPFDEEVMLSIVRSAITDNERLAELRQEALKARNVSTMIMKSDYAMQTLEQASTLTTHLASLFPDPARVSLGISELLVNALEHGNLGITYEEKGRLIEEDIWQSEVVRLQSSSEHKNKWVRVHYERFEDRVHISISDEGKGFEWQDYMQISPDRATDTHGRGIAMSNLMSFDKVEYIGCGNEVHCQVYLR